MSFHTLTVAGLADGLASGQFTSRELTQYFLDRIAQHDPALNSYITVTAEQALDAADAADQRRAAGEAGALTGVPMAHKDLFGTPGEERLGTLNFDPAKKLAPHALPPSKPGSAASHPVLLDLLRLCLEDAGQFRRALQRHGRATAGGGGCRHAGQDEHG